LLKKDTHLSEKEKEKKFKEILDLVGDPYAPRDFAIPDYLCCKISLDIMEDPVTTQSGHSYERAVLMEHLRKNGLFDPVTRDPISMEHIYPNLNLKQAIETFLKENPWAFEHKLNESFADINF